MTYNEAWNNLYSMQKPGSPAERQMRTLSNSYIDKRTNKTDYSTCWLNLRKYFEKDKVAEMVGIMTGFEMQIQQERQEELGEKLSAKENERFLN